MDRPELEAVTNALLNVSERSSCEKFLQKRLICFAALMSTVGLNFYCSPSFSEKKILEQILVIRQNESEKRSALMCNIYLGLPIIMIGPAR